MNYNKNLNTTFLCNYNKHNTQNKKIYEYNFTQNLSNPPILYRGGFNICNEHIDLDKNNIDLTKDLNNKIVNFENIKHQFIPGKGQGSDFLRYIDVDSELKNLNRIDTKCRQISCKNILPQQQNNVVKLENNNYRKTITYEDEDCDILKVGPNRINHTTENIWNNITKRKNINN